MKLGSVILIGLVVVTSCVAVLDLDPREQFVVVHGVLVNESEQVIDLHYTSYLSDNYMTPIQNAEVWVEEEDYEGMVRRTYRYEPVGNGRYKAEFLPRFETRYNLVVKVRGYREITASTLYPCDDNFSNLQAFPQLYYFDTAYIPLYLWIYGQEYNAKIQAEQQPLYMNEVLGEFSIPAVEADSFNEVADRASLDFVSHWRYLRYELGTTTLPSTNIYSGNSLKEVAVLRLYPDFTNAAEGNRVIFESVSEEYDKYLKDIVSFEMGLEHTEHSDFSSLYDHHSIYTNVQNGVGIFGAVIRYEIKPLNGY